MGAGLKRGEGGLKGGGVVKGGVGGLRRGGGLHEVSDFV